MTGRDPATTQAFLPGDNTSNRHVHYVDVVDLNHAYGPYPYTAPGHDSDDRPGQKVHLPTFYHLFNLPCPVRTGSEVSLQAGRGISAPRARRWICPSDHYQQFTSLATRPNRRTSWDCLEQCFSPSSGRSLSSLIAALV
jgi:hypothetical protein